ncbi:FAD-binding oxidoreductase [Paraburkholderia aspalathi]|uniref:NAD(P)/FAD-dependent oxidoreductase n=1 Tax=Paraburkholderia nemoris TaxID=2793076 RepID=UPI00190A5680|nr:MULTISPECIES: FAD-dependent oxidoreductase [Paraburkholderia]MBK3787043.1 FAD-binding oxidoreductase [Paraburkholderia aspalathi]
MKILLLDLLDQPLQDSLLADNVIYRPDLLNKSHHIFTRMIVENRIDALVSRDPIPAKVVADWAAARTSPAYVVRVVTPDPNASDLLDYAPAGEIQNGNSIALQALGKSLQDAYVNAFDALEARSIKNALHKRRAQDDEACPPAGKMRHEKVLMVGAGLVNLVTAYRLQQAGYAIHLVDARPEPTKSSPWTAFGCSHGGDDARMFTLSEMDNYNDRQVSLTMNNLFRRSVTELGWNVHWKQTLSESELDWVREFEGIPVWLANKYNEDIFSFARASLSKWTEWIKRDSALFTASLLREGILRLYSDETQFANAVRRQNRIGATLEVLTPAEVAHDHPALAEAVRGGYIAGAVYVIGFTVNSHKFVRHLVQRLSAGGAEFSWGERAEQILFDEGRRVTGIQFGNAVLEADHYVLSPGAYGNDLLEGTESKGKIHGVLGAWLRIPNLEPELRHSLKLARKGHITEDANITVATDEAGKPILIIGSGYGHTGIDPRNIDQAQLQQIYLGLVDTAAKYFPTSYAAALAAGNMADSFKYCVRPWTSSGLGVFEMLPASNGGRCVITGGHNTGGFAQSPEIAQAVFDAIEHRDHPMHFAYYPNRPSAFLSAAVAQSRDAETTAAALG